jgi:hypothetical protein
VRDAIVASGCDRLGIANWILLEYPIWVGLDHAGWRGKIEHVRVQNASATLAESGFEPCALVTEPRRGPRLDVPAGWSEFSYGELAAAFDPRSAARLGVAADSALQLGVRGF